jgi:hypothetical protein
MDTIALDSLLGDGSDRQFWLKPVGPPKDHPDWDAPEDRTWSQSQVEIHFSRSPARVAVGAIIIAYRVRYQKLIYVAQRLPVAEWGPSEVRSEYSRRRWPHLIKVRNLTPQYGAVWNQYSLRPFELAREYNEHSLDQPARLGSILRGNDKTAIPRPYAECLIRCIREIPQGLTV